MHQLLARCRSRRSKMGIYIYGIIDSNEQISQSIYGLEGTAVYNIPFHDIGVVASDLDEPIEDITEANVIAHEAAVEGLMEYFAVLPVKFLTIFDRREDVISMMGIHYDGFRDDLHRLRGKVEFGIKVIWPASKIKQSIISTYRKNNLKVPVSGKSPEKMFIAEKFEDYEIDRAFDDKASKTINPMDIALSRFTAEKELEKLKTENLLLSAVYLVEKDEQDDFREAFENVRAAHTGFKFLFSGPWPPYSFVRLPNKPRQFKHLGQQACLTKQPGSQRSWGADRA